MRILLTGASGFIGRNLLASLAAQDTRHTIVAVSRHRPQDLPPGVEWNHADMAQAGWTRALPAEGCDAIVHLAQSQHYRDFPARVVDLVDVNVTATVELADWAASHRVRRFLFASTGNVYGTQKGVHDEQDTCAPDSMYAASKLCGEILLKPFSQSMDVVVMRLFGVYGPGQTNALMPAVIQQFFAGNPITLGGGVGVMFNPIYVGDCCSVMSGLLVAAVDGYRTFNVGGPEVVDLKDVALLLEEATGRRASIRITDDPPKYLVGSVERLRRLVHLERQTSLADGLRAMLAAQTSRTPV